MQERVIGHVQVGNILAAQRCFDVIEDFELLYAVGHQPFLGLLQRQRSAQHGQFAVGAA
ncbi:hypothetical protein D9M71_480150 [compost metagenome]